MTEVRPPKGPKRAYEPPTLVKVGDFTRLTLGFLRWRGPDSLGYRR